MKKTDLTLLTGGAFVALFVLIFGVSFYGTFFTDERVNVVIDGKERITVSNGDRTESKYLIFTDKEVFENTDTLLRGKFNSSDFYGKIKVGQTCNFLVSGWRVPFLSMYRNILEYDCK